MSLIQKHDRLGAILAVIFLISFLILSLLLYSRFKAERTSSEVFYLPLTSETLGYSLLSQGRCVGLLDISLSEDRGVQLRTEGTLIVSLNGKPADLIFNSLLLFNPLGQLYSADAALTLNQSRASLKLEGVNPLKLEYSARHGEWQHSGNSQIPGPIVIKKEAAGKYWVSGVGALAANFRINQEGFSSLIDLLTLAIRSSSDAQTGCSKDTLSPLDTGFVQELLSQTALMNMPGDTAK